ncbi:hypothetical protein MVEN_01335900 [Mycena venus]|uniref:Uncharacterized protein n=1 Tax=Mycena venus TaxID=2733690 RepID=A0A8H6Y210_9AGAR|nr:hypothetical protein MVEN_01335900 [Mycena venus]
MTALNTRFIYRHTFLWLLLFTALDFVVASIYLFKMWITTFIATLVFFLALTSHVAAQVTLNDPSKCFTLSTNGTQYLDSTNSVLAIQVHPDRAALEAGTDKGVRFHFPLGEKGWVVCEAHNDHFVGTTIPNAVQWSTEDSLGATVALATIHISASGKQVFLNAGPRKHMTSTAGVSTTEFDWDIQEINCLVNK